MIIYRWVKRYLEVYEEQKSLQDENNLHHKKNQVRNKGIVGKEKVILAGNHRDKTMANKFMYTSKLMKHKITPSVD